MSLLWNRACKLFVYTPNQKVLDLSEFRITFRVQQSDIQTPNNAFITVYNLSRATAQMVSGEFQRVKLQAGYDFPGGSGVIFDGTIKQVLFGHESNVDSVVRILAADGDEAYSANMNTVLPAGYTPQDEVTAIATAMDVPVGYIMNLPVTAGARGKIFYGMAHAHLRDFADTHEANWSIQNGQLTIIPRNDFRPDAPIVVLNSATGLIGFPEQTPGGINVTSLINPKIVIGGLIEIQPEDINQGLVQQSGPVSLRSPGRLEHYSFNIAQISGAGYYKVLVVEYEGDTRGDPWYCHLVCLAVDLSAAVGQRVKSCRASTQVYGNVTLGQPTWE